MTPEQSELDVAIIGAGLSGTLTALQLARQAGGLRVCLLERSGVPASGLAYSTPDKTHLLNVRADRMSAFPAEPDGFMRWLAAQETGSVYRVDTDAGTFVSRQAYGRYLSSLLDAACSVSSGRLEVRGADVTAIRRDGDSFTLLAGQRVIRAGAVVLAMGNLARPFVLPDGSKTASPWRARAFDGLVPDAPLAIIGTGLTMIDVVTSLRRRGHSGLITAISRRGLTPLSHAALSRLPDAGVLEISSGPLSRRLKQMRQAARLYGWREVIDCLRPVTQTLWQGFSAQEKQRFLRHARPWWDMHRHRVAEPVATALAAELQSASLAVLAGRIVEGGAGRLVVRQRGEAGDVVLSPARIFDATGFGPLGQSGDTLVNDLLDSGLAAADETGLGLAVSAGLGVLGKTGSTDGLYAIGPLVRGVYWECTAVPDIRIQAESLARRIAASPR